jgi:hypothetical protein
MGSIFPLSHRQAGWRARKFNMDEGARRSFEELSPVKKKKESKVFV